jgi:ATP-binding cassette subfamily B protein
MTPKHIQACKHLGPWQILRRLWPYLRAQRALLLFSLGALLAQVAFHALEPWPLKFVFDHLLRARRGGRLTELGPAPQGLDPGTLLLLAALAVVLITGLRALASYASACGVAVAANRILTAVRIAVYRKLQSLSLAYHSKSRSGDLIVRLVADVNMLKQIAINAVLPLVADLLIVLIMFVVMFALNWRLALVTLAPLPLFCFWTARLTRRVRAVGRLLRQREANMAGTAAEALGATRLVQTLALEESFERLFQQQNLESQREDIRVYRLTAGLGRMVGVLTAISMALVLWYGTRLVLEGDLTPGELLVFLAYLRTAFRPLHDFGKYSGRLAKATAAAERVFDILDRTPDVCDQPDASPAPAFSGAVRFERVSFAYEPGQRVLDDIDFEVVPGRHVALVGPSGVGKTTLTGLLLRLYDPVAGRVLIDGRDIREYTLASLRRQFSVVLQDPYLFAVSIADNIAFGSAAVSLADIEAAARLTNADEFIQRLPHGYDTVLGERGVTLSNGQRQRLALARAAVRQSPILIFDEPTTGLDRDNESAVLAALERLSQGRTCFFISHDLTLAARADEVLYLEDCRIIERGSHTELFEQNGRYSKLYRQQLAVRDGPQARKVHAAVYENQLAPRREEQDLWLPEVRN